MPGAYISGSQSAGKVHKLLLTTEVKIFANIRPFNRRLPDFYFMKLRLRRILATEVKKLANYAK